MSFVFFFSHKPGSYSKTKINQQQKPWIYSNWYPSEYTNEGVTFCCVEQEMMYRKAMLFGDTEIAAKILATTDAKKIKAYGREVSNFDEEVWGKNKYDIVYNACYAKFSQIPELRTALLSTKGTLVEASPYDRVWGIGFRAGNALENQEKWGDNLLGEALTQVREDL